MKEKQILFSTALGCERGDLTRRAQCPRNCRDGENCVTWFTKQFMRLAAYEDTGLSPEEVQGLAKAKAEGRLVVLPCKVGQKVWIIKDGKIDSGFVAWFETGDIRNPQWTVAVQNAPRAPAFVPFESVYITREEAEKVLQDVKKS